MREAAERATRETAREVIAAVKQKLAEAMKSLPADVKVTVTYDRSALIGRISTVLSALITYA